MNYLTYPCKVMKLTQNHSEGNHINHSSGKPLDYPIDEACEGTGRSCFYCPCDEMRVVKLYTAGVNTVWLSSAAPVVMPMGSAFVTMMVEHLNDDDMRRLAVGQVFHRGEKMFREGNDGAVGNHFHISVGTGSIRAGGWEKNSKGAWVLRVTGRPITAAEAFYITETEILCSGGYALERVEKEKEMDNIPDQYAATAVAWAIQNKILLGDEQGDQRLHQPITRQDALVMLYRALQIRY